MIEQTYIQTSDGSNTLFSAQYHQHFHSTQVGAFSEALFKHVVPAFHHHAGKTHLRILDICFGLGYNTWATLYHILTHKLNISVEIFSPELDGALIQSLHQFEFPSEFDTLKPIIKAISKEHFFNDNQFNIQVYCGDARDYVKTLSDIDIVYQDAFSSEVNQELWTREYFKELAGIMNNDAILTTYSVATPVRLGLYENEFFLYETNALNKKITLAFKRQQPSLAPINMAHKLTAHPDAKSFSDREIK